MSLRVVFMGTPEFAVPTLSELISVGHDVVAVYTQPPRPSGRGKNVRPSPVQTFAELNNIAVETPVSLKDSDTLQIFSDYRPEVAVVVAYGLILPQNVLDTPDAGCLNLHASLLPRWRGAAPIQRAIMAGDQNTGIMVMRMEAGLDTGPVCLGEQVPIRPTMTAGDLHDELAQLGAGLMTRALAALSRGSLECRPQPSEGVTYAEKIEKSEARINWSDTAPNIHNQIRGLSPFPGAWFAVKAGDRIERIKILRSEISDRSGNAGDVLEDGTVIACGEGAVKLLEVQRSGKKVAAMDEFLRGFPLKTGDLEMDE